MSQLKIKDGNNWVSIPAGGIGVPSGGNTGEYLIKSSATDYATEWAFHGIELLWTNPSPMSAYGGGTTISFDPSPYDYFILICTFNVSDNANKATTIITKDGLNSFAQLNGAGQGCGREFEITSSGMSVGTGMRPGTGWDNGRMVPYKIYGVKV